jgi:hypothetical protein
MASARPLALGAAFLAGAAAGRLMGPEQLRTARMAGWSIAAPDAVGWVTDFLNAAYYRREPDERDVDDLRLAFTAVTTYWHRHGHRRLRALDVLAFHRAYGRFRLERPRGTLDREQLLAGGVRLLGPWFPDAAAERRGWGIAFETLAERAAYDPEWRLSHARLGDLTPGRAEPRAQTWHTYRPVPVPSAAAVAEALSAPETWPDYGTAIGRFTPVRPRGLAGQTFEIEVAAGAQAGRPVFTRGYVTATTLHSRDADAAALRAYVAKLNEGLVRYGSDEPPAVPGDAEPVLALELTTHEGHFMGAGCNRLVLYERDGSAHLRAAGTWDPMPWHLAQAYELAGREAQHAFWGEGEPHQSLLHQIARAVSEAVTSAQREAR